MMQLILILSLLIIASEVSGQIIETSSDRVEQRQKQQQEIEQIVTIVGQDETDFANNCISWTSPLAKFLLRKTIGESFIFKTPSGEDIIEILDVSYT